MEDFGFIIDYDQIIDTSNEEKSKLIAKMYVASDYYEKGDIENYLTSISELDINLVDKV